MGVQIPHSLPLPAGEGPDLELLLDSILSQSFVSFSSEGAAEGAHQAV